MRWVAAADLETWAQSELGSRVDLAKVVSDLIRASVTDIASMRFPSGDKGQVRGFDGHLVCASPGMNTPEGESFWEFGTEKDYQAKAQSDFDKRTKEVSIEIQKKSSFVFVTPWTWDSSKADNKIENWVAAAKKTSSWKEVYYLDGVSLESWLDSCPAAATWHARETFKVKPQDGVRSTDEFWSDFAGRFRPDLTEEVVLCGREGIAGQALQELMRPANALQIIADATDEAIAFAVAAIRKADPAIRLYLEARTLIVDSAAAGRLLPAQGKLVLLLRKDAATSPKQFLSIGSLLVPLGRKQNSTGAIVLDRPGGQAMGIAMKSMGLEENQALTYARGSGRSLRALARLIPGGRYVEPSWLNHGADLLPGILAGAWDAGNDLDRAVIERIVGTGTYVDFEGRLRRSSRDEEDPPFDLESTIWKVRAPMDAFVCVGPLIDEGYAARLRDVMLEVFSAVEPEADPDEVVRFTRPNPTGYSDWLRDGLATTFLLIAVWSQTANVNLGRQSGQDWANRLLTDLPGLNSNPRVLASLKNELPLLAEAAPDPLLAALERMLEGNGELIRPIFEGRDGLLFPSYDHTGLLWALETIAWNPDYFRRAVMVLAGLAAIAPKMRIVNSPANSLAEIFVLWAPNTNASASVRLSSLREICQRYPSVGWTLVHRLLPSTHGVSSPTAKPKLREGGASDRADVTYRELWEIQEAVSALAIEQAADDDAKWLEMIPGLAGFSTSSRDAAIKALDGVMARAAPESQKRLWVKLRDEVARHERFQDTQWALDADNLAPLKAVVDKYAPEDPVASIVVLFDNLILDSGGDIVAGNRRRAEVLRNLFEQNGPEAVVRLAEETKAPYSVAEAIGAGGYAEDDISQILDISIRRDPRSTLSVGLSAQYRGAIGAKRAEEWIRRCATEMAPDVVSRLMMFWPDDPSTWHIVRRLGQPVIDSYWQCHPTMFLTGSVRSVIHATLMYLRYGRAVEAIQSSMNRLSELPVGLIYRMLDGVIPEINAGKAHADTMTTYYVESALAALDRRDDVPLLKVAQLEFSFFPLLEHGGGRRLKIYTMMAESAEFYHDILRTVFRGRHEEVAEPTDHEKSVARRSYSLLRNLTETPGLHETGLDEAALRSWIDKVRELGTETDRADVTDNFVGRLLAHSPADPVDTGWPHRIVRSEIDRIGSEELERGLQLERFNMRGVHGKQLYEGGAQERTFAEENENWAKIAEAWPRTAAVLRAISKNWEQHAEHEDKEARLRKLRS